MCHLNEKQMYTDKILYVFKFGQLFLLSMVFIVLLLVDNNIPIPLNFSLGEFFNIMLAS